jgi:hypothetical protein
MYIYFQLVFSCRSFLSICSRSRCTDYVILTKIVRLDNFHILTKIVRLDNFHIFGIVVVINIILCHHAKLHAQVFFIRHQTISEILFRSLHYQPAQVLNCFCFPGAWFIRSGKGGCCHLFSPLLFLLMFSSRCQRPIYKATLQGKQFV